MVNNKKLSMLNNASNNVKNAVVNNVKNAVVNNVKNAVANNVKNAVANNVKNAVAAPKKKFTKALGRKIIIGLAVVLLIVLIAVGGYMLYKKITYYKANDLVTKTFIPYIHNATNGKTIQSAAIPKSVTGNEYNYNMWIYISDYTYRNDEDKCILYRGPNPAPLPLNNSSNNLPGGVPNTIVEQANPSVWLLRGVNTLRVRMGLETDYDIPLPNMNSNENFADHSKDIKSGECEKENVPLQRWININISQYNNIIDLSVDGKLEVSYAAPGAPIMTHKNNLYVCNDGGFNGYIANLKISNQALTISEIYDIYKSGPVISKSNLF